MMMLMPWIVIKILVNCILYLIVCCNKILLLDTFCKKNMFSIHVVSNKNFKSVIA